MKRAILCAACALLSTLAMADDAAFLGDAACKVINPAAPAGARAAWKGACKDGYADGEGVLVMTTGGASDGKFDGSFEGRLERGQLAEGYFKSADGTRYEGPFKHGRRDGMGVLIESTGDRYDGAWVNGRRHGQGSQVYVLGGRYDGGWNDDRFDGKGSLSYAGGHQVSGQFLHGALVDSSRPAPATGVDSDADADKAGKFNLKADFNFAGSSIKRDAVTGSGVPFDKGYAAMTPAQQARIRSQYKLLEDGDEPPYPLAGTKQQFKWISDMNMRFGAPVGRLRVIVMVDANGDATQVAVYETPDPKFTPIITAMMRETKFKPAVCGGKPCAMAYPIYANMTRTMR